MPAQRLRTIPVIVVGSLAYCATAIAGEPVAFTLFGGNAPHEKAAGGNAVGNYAAWAEDIAPRLKKHGITRIHWQNPGGVWPLAAQETGADWRDMRVDQWIIAERVRAPYANRRDLRTAIAYLERHGVTENIIYLGDPKQLLDPVKELTECVEPFLVGPSVSIGFDALFDPQQDWRAQWSPGSPYREALIELRKRCKVYAEPRLTKEQVQFGLGELIDGTIAQASYDANPAFNVDLSIQPGEIMRTTDALSEEQWRKWGWSESIREWPKSVTPQFRSQLNWGPLMDQ